VVEEKFVSAMRALLGDRNKLVTGRSVKNGGFLFEKLSGTCMKMIEHVPLP